MIKSMIEILHGLLLELLCAGDDLCGRFIKWQVLINVVCFPQTTPPVVPRAHKKSIPWGGGAPQNPPNLSAAVAASAGQEGPTVIALVGSRRGLRRPLFGVMSKISQDQHV